MNKIKVEVKNVYGHTLVYPACEVARLLVALSERKTFNKVQLECLKKLGYDIEVISPQFSGVA